MGTEWEQTVPPIIQLKKEPLNVVFNLSVRGRGEAVIRPSRALNDTRCMQLDGCNSCSAGRDG